MNEEIYEKAREAIKARRFEEARKYLMPIAHEPKAQAWLAKLSQVTPPQVEIPAIPTTREKVSARPPVPVVTPPPKEKSGGGVLITALVGLLTFVLGLGGGYLAFGGESEPEVIEKLAVITATSAPTDMPTATLEATVTLTETPTVTASATVEVVAIVPTETTTMTATQQPSRTPRPTWTPSAEAICNAAVQEWWDEAEPIAIEFLDTAEVAVSTSRASLSSLILELQRLTRDFEGIDPPGCKVEPYAYTLGGMRLAVDGFNAFLADNEPAYGANFEIANAAWYTAWYSLADSLVVGDTRMGMTSLIWGEKQPEGTLPPPED